MKRKILALLFAVLIVLAASPIATAQFMNYHPGRMMFVLFSAFTDAAANRSTAASDANGVRTFTNMFTSAANFGNESHAICFASNQDDATDHNMDTMTYGDSNTPCEKIAEVDSVNVNIAAFTCPNHVSDTTISTVTDASEAIATNGANHCMTNTFVGSQGAIQVASAAIGAATQLNMNFTNLAPYSTIACFATAYGGTDRNHTWTDPGGTATLQAEDYDADVENITRTSSGARFFLSASVAAQPSSLTIRDTLNANPTAAAGLCLAFRSF